MPPTANDFYCKREIVLSALRIAPQKELQGN